MYTLTILYLNSFDGNLCTNVRGIGRLDQRIQLADPDRIRFAEL